MSHGDRHIYERGNMSGFGNARASTSGNPGEGSSATLSDPTQLREQPHVRSYVPQIEHLIEKYRTGDSNIKSRSWWNMGIILKALCGKETWIAWPNYPIQQGSQE